MTRSLDASLPAAVELLDRALAYTRVTLTGVRHEDLLRPTPCAAWTLARLLEHMEDSLDAFTEAAAGHVAVEPAPSSSTRVEALRHKACALLGAWTAAHPTTVAVDDRDLAAELLVRTAALEITVHGWDVAQATGHRTPVPHDLARALLAVAEEVVGPADRGRRFAAARPVSAAAPYTERLLAFVGRSGRPDWSTRGELSEPPAQPEVAS